MNNKNKRARLATIAGLGKARQESTERLTDGLSPSSPLLDQYPEQSTFVGTLEDRAMLASEHKKACDAFPGFRELFMPSPNIALIRDVPGDQADRQSTREVLVQALLKECMACLEQNGGECCDVCVMQSIRFFESAEANQGSIAFSMLSRN